MPKGRPSVSAKVAELEEKLNRVLEKLEKPVETPPVTTFPEPAPVAGAPVPVDFREIVDQVLNKHFGVRINPRPDSPQFEFVVVVPEKYSHLTPAEKKLMHEDLRTKVMGYADGPAGVREWAQKVYESFNQEIKAQIVADRL